MGFYRGISGAVVGVDALGDPFRNIKFAENSVNERMNFYIFAT